MTKNYATQDGCGPTWLLARVEAGVCRDAQAFLYWFTVTIPKTIRAYRETSLRYS
ncbi:MAG: hypothetical protein HQL77_15175 [Magnetococcales bacterium]|nr:hypothetical protein [Magnetococcales bacterium]